MYNPDAYSPCEKQMGRRENKPFPVAPALCRPCAMRDHQDCWGKQCSCSCNKISQVEGE